VVLFVKRYKKKAADNPRGSGLSYNRVLGDPEALAEGFARAGAPLVECCDFGAAGGVAKMLEVVSAADVVVSLHGAGLINGIFARAGGVLIELHGSYGADDVIFRRLAQGRQSGYLRARVDESADHHAVGAARAFAVAACAVDLFNDRPCAPHPDIEESWRPRDMGW
jgi:capsular polysaccharide biosynthesis protein